MYLVVVGILSRNNVINTIKLYTVLYIISSWSLLQSNINRFADDELSLRIISFVIAGGHVLQRMVLLLCYIDHYAWQMLCLRNTFNQHVNVKEIY